LNDSPIIVPFREKLEYVIESEALLAIDEVMGEVRELLLDALKRRASLEGRFAVISKREVTAVGLVLWRELERGLQRD
jgi:hypothetical protein